MERKSLRELSHLYDAGKVPILQYIRSLESRLQQSEGVTAPLMNDKERIANAHEWIEAKRARTHAEQELKESARESYPTYDSEVRALCIPLAKIRIAQVHMDACLERLAV